MKNFYVLVFSLLVFGSCNKKSEKFAPVVPPVIPPVAVPLISSVTISKLTVELNHFTSLKPVITGDTSNAVYSWTGDDNFSTTTKNIVFMGKTLGTKTLIFTVTIGKVTDTSKAIITVVADDYRLGEWSDSLSAILQLEKNAGSPDPQSGVYGNGIFEEYTVSDTIQAWYVFSSANILNYAYTTYGNFDLSTKQVKKAYFVSELIALFGQPTSVPADSSYYTWTQDRQTLFFSTVQDGDDQFFFDLEYRPAGYTPMSVVQHNRQLQLNRRKIGL